MAKGFKFPAPQGFAKGGMCKPKGAKGYAKGGPARGTNMEATDIYDPSDLRTLEAGQNVPRENKNRMRSESVQNARAKADLKKNYDDMYSFNPRRMMDSDVGGAYTRMRATEGQTGEYKKGGKVMKHDDAAMDKKLIKKMVKPSAMKKAEGGQARSESTEYERARRDLQNNKPVTIMDDWVGAFDKAKAENNASRDATRESLKNKMRATGGYAKGGKAQMAKAKLGRKFMKFEDGGEVETQQMASKATKVKMPRGAAPKGRAKAVPVAPRAPMIAPQAAPMAGGMAPSPLSRVARAQAPMPGNLGMKMGGKAKKY